METIVTTTENQELQASETAETILEAATETAETILEAATEAASEISEQSSKTESVPVNPAIDQTIQNLSMKLDSMAESLNRIQAILDSLEEEVEEEESESPTPITIETNIPPTTEIPEIMETKKKSLIGKILLG